VPPNNWAAAFGGQYKTKSALLFQLAKYLAGSAWTYDEATAEYYLHLFAPEQPDLNWECPAVVQAVHDIMEFWLKKGVDGFRMDVINFISKEPGLPDAEVTTSDPDYPYQNAIDLFCNGPRLHEHLRGLRAILDKYGAFSVGEMPGAKTDEQVANIVAAHRKELHTIFQFDM
jgi:glycosidase